MSCYECESRYRAGKGDGVKDGISIGYRSAEKKRREKWLMWLAIALSIETQLMLAALLLSR
jgi:hypothetical protein